MKPNKTEKKETGCRCCCAAIGCGIPALLAVCIASWIATAAFYHEFGENRPTASMFNAKGGKDFCYDFTYLNRYCEFDITEPDFSAWCSGMKYPWEPIEIETLPSLPKYDWKDDVNVNYRRKVPMSIVRYCSTKTDHEDCEPRFGECQVDPRNETGKQCFCLINDGYYYERRGRNGGGVYVLFDRKTNRCYIEWNHH